MQHPNERDESVTPSREALLLNSRQQHDKFNFTEDVRTYCTHVPAHVKFFMFS